MDPGVAGSVPERPAKGHVTGWRMPGRDNVRPMSRDLDARLRDALWAWDPYGIADARSEVPEEYDNFLDELNGLLRTDPTKAAVSAWLVTTLDGLGLLPVPEEDRAFADRVIHGWATAGQRP
jgi:hypothetical protein